ncbi:MAG: preQ(1) synthase [Planctomycetota bacterium]
MPKDQLRRGRALPHATLGRRRATPFTYAPRLLEAVPLPVGRQFAQPGLWVCLRCLRFTSLCPVTGQPDWATITVNYIPDAKLVESKSLKEYLTSFRNHGDFHEDVVRIICDDLVKLMSPRYLEVVGRFDTRGSIAIWPFVQYARADDADAEDIRLHRLRNFAPGLYDGREPSAE